MKINKLQVLLASGAAALLVAACGGGGGDIPPKAAISRVIVAGDSLADVGVFGFKFTIQDSTNPAGFPVFPQLVARDYGIANQCNYYVFNGATFVANSTPGCTNYAIGGGRALAPVSQGGAASQLTVGTQLAQAAAVNGANWSPSDLILIDGGSNDAGDLITYYLELQTNPTDFVTRMTQLGVSTANLATPGGAEADAKQSMVNLADYFAAAIKASTTAKGATHVAVLNATDVTLTPKLQMVLASIAASRGAATATALQALFRDWIVTYNNELKAQLSGDSFAVVDFYSDTQEEIANPASFALTNVTTPACPITGTDSSGLPTYNFPTCTSAALDAAPPSGLSAGWWHTWTFSDSFHPTPYAHQLLSASVARALARAGWL